MKSGCREITFRQPLFLSYAMLDIFNSNTREQSASLKSTADKVLVYICVFITILAILIVVAYFVLTKVNLRYTIGETVGRPLSGRFVDVNYKYHVGGKEYYAGAGNRLNAKVPGGRYLVKFNVWIPNMSTMDFDYELKDSTVVPPDDGWQKIPDDRIWVK